jgi:hypothetical protein
VIVFYFIEVAGLVPPQTDARRVRRGCKFYIFYVQLSIFWFFLAYFECSIVFSEFDFL